MYDDNGNVLDAVLHDVMYVPGLSRRLFSITRFARHGHYATILSGSTTLYFGEQQSPVTLTNDGSRAMAADATVVVENPQHAIPYRRSHDHSANKKRTSLELLHQRLGHRKCRALLDASEHGVWADTLVHMGPEEECVSCDISTARASNRNKEAHTGGLYPGEYVFLDILHPLVPVGLTRDSTFAFSLILVDAYSRYACIYGMLDKSSSCVIDTLLRFQADHGHIGNYGYLDIARIRADSGTQFTSQEFKEHCWQAGITLSLAAPKKQYQNHLAERSWQTIGNMARSLLVHARLPDSFMHHALAYSCHIFNALPVKGLFLDGHVSTPFEMFQGAKPKIGHLRVFGCPITARHWITAQNSGGKQTQRGIQGIFIGLAANQKGYLFYSPASRQIFVSGDVTFDEQFSSTIATTWRPHRDNVALRPVASHIPTVSTTIEQTGDVVDTLPSIVDEGAAHVDADDIPPLIPHSVEEGETHVDEDDGVKEGSTHVDENDDDDCPALSRQSHDDSDSEADSICSYDSEDDDDLDDDDILDFELPTSTIEEDISPQPTNVSRYGRIRKPNPRYANQAKSYEWEARAIGTNNKDLAHACAVESTPPLPSSSDALSLEPAPSTIRDIVKMPEGVVKQEWLKSVKKELKTLVNANTFQEDTLHEGETSTPVMEIFKVKIKSDGSLDKLKTRLVVRGDLQDKNITEDKWSPTASFQSLKMFLGHASQLKARVKQLDFVGAFLQAKMRTRMFVIIPKIFGILFPEYAWCTGKPVRLLMSMYGTTLCGKYWYLDLLEFLKEIGFKEGDCVKCSFIKEFSDGSKIYLLNYVDDMLYHGTDLSKLQAFEKQLGERFQLELLGNAHWYLGSRINQLQNFDIEIDQSRYCKAIVKKYLDTAGYRKIGKHHDAPLPSGFIATVDDCSASEEESKALSEGLNIDFASCIGSLIYLSMTRTDIIYAVNKLAKLTRRPGQVHFEALLHLLRYLRDNSLYGVRFYSNISDAPLYQMLLKQNIEEKHTFFGFTDSSWNDDPDNGRSTGCYIITYMGGIIDHSSNMPDPVALSSAEAEYNEGCVAFMAASHLRMLLCEFLGVRDEETSATSMYFDSKSAIAMGVNYKDTKHSSYHAALSLCARKYCSEPLHLKMD
jgi:hypothetical protein